MSAERRIEQIRGGIWVVRDPHTGKIVSTHGRKDEARSSAAEVVRQYGGGHVITVGRRGESRLPIDARRHAGAEAHNQ